MKSKITFFVLFVYALIISCESHHLNLLERSSEKIETSPRQKILKSENPIQSGPYFLVLSDIHLDVDSTDVSYGNDTGMTLWKRTKEKLDSILTGSNAPDFVLYLGDLPSHKNWDHPRPAGSHEKDLDAVLTGLRGLMSKVPNIPLLYLPGNNDAIWGDYCEFSDPPSELPPFSLDHGYARFWPAINVPVQTGAVQPPFMINDKFRNKGFYSVYPLKNKDLRVIALNTVIFSVSDCDDSNHLWTDRKADADEMLNFLKSELDSAYAHNEKVIIAMHIPPGLDTYCKKSKYSHPSCYPKTPSAMWNSTIEYNRETIQERFLKYIWKRQNSIVGVFTSHTHMDEIRLLSYHGDTMAVAISAPGISPNHGQNPGFKKVYYQSGSTYELTDFTTLYTTLEDVQVKGKWGEKSYTFRSSYGCNTNCTATSIMDCIRCKDSNELYSGMSETFAVKRAGLLCCNVQPMMLVTESQR